MTPCEALKRMLQARRTEGFPLRSLQVPKRFEGRLIWTDGVEFIDTEESGFREAMAFHWSEWPPSK